VEPAKQEAPASAEVSVPVEAAEQQDGPAEDVAEETGEPEAADLYGEDPGDADLKDRIGPLSHDGYTLEQVVVLSRHNIRAPLSGKGSALDTMTPHEWYEWSSAPSELSVRGGTLETGMGQYFRKWLEEEGLFPTNYRPSEEAVRIYANSRQRTIATAQFFTAGLLPVCNKDVEYRLAYEGTDGVFGPFLSYSSEAYQAFAEEEMHRIYDPVIAGLEDNYALLAEVIDAEESEDYQNGVFTGFVTDDSVFGVVGGKEPSVSGSLRLACTISDALVLQFYEEPDSAKAAFGHELSWEEWESIAEIKDVYEDALFTVPEVAVNTAHPLLCEIDRELMTEGRQFTFLCGHDSNVAGVLAALRTENYSLPCAIEKKTPIGVKLVICRWRNAEEEEVISLDLVYQTVKQLRECTLLGLSEPPAIYGLRLKGLAADADGCYKADEVMMRLEEVIGEYDALPAAYDPEEENEEETGEAGEADEAA
ncbi:MAG: histidine-type phosphatase, partial [Lachnospiraceae bacterium]|nr:histidine-type phosphatase [Lachnospiraceae bacterium]